MAEILKVEMLPPLRNELQMFRRDRLNHLPTFSSDGRKLGMALSLGYPGYNTSEVATASEQAELACHARNGVGVIGPTDIAGVPYPLIVVQEKGRAVKDAMNLHPTEYGAFIVSDTVFYIEDPDRLLSFTAHKPRTPQDKIDLIRLLMGASEKGGVHLSTMAGLYRFEHNHPDPLADELYMVQTHLGLIKKKLDMGNIFNILSSNGGKKGTAGGLTVPTALAHLVEPQEALAVDVYRFGEDLKVVNKYGIIHPKDAKTVLIPSYKDPDELNRIGVGFIS